MADTKGIRAGRAFVELGVSDKLTAGLRRAQRQLQAFGEGLRSIGMRMTAVAATVLAPLGAAVKLFSDTGDTLNDMADRTGVSAEALSELGFAAEQSGADLETLETGLRKMQKLIGDAAGGSTSASDALGQLGLSMASLQGLVPEQQFKLIAERLSQVADPTLRAAAAMEVFGKSGTRLLPLVQDGARGIEDLRKQARALGLTVSTETAKDAALLNDTLNALWRVLKQGVFVVGSALGPTVVELSSAVTRAVVSVTNWVRQNQALVVTAAKVATVVAVAGVALVGLGWAVSAIAAGLGTLASIVSGVGTALGVIGSALAALLSPIGLVIAAVVALGGALLVSTGTGADALAWLGEQFKWLRETVFKVVTGITDALTAGDMGMAARILWLSLKLAWQQGVAALNGVWLECKRFFISTAQTMWYGALAAAEEVFHGLEVAWIETTAFLSTTWTNFTSGFQKAWNEAINWTTKRLLELQGVFDDSFDVEAAKRMADEDLAGTNAQIEQQRQAAVQAREQHRQGERDQAASVNEATLAEIGKQFDQAQKGLDTETDAKLAGTRQALAEARKQLDDALAAARTKREAADKAGGPPAHKFADPLADLEDRLAGLGSLMAGKISVAGTFNAVAAGGLATGSNAAERTAAASEQTAKNTKRLADAAAAGGLRFR